MVNASGALRHMFVFPSLGSMAVKIHNPRTKKPGMFRRTRSTQGIHKPLHDVRRSASRMLKTSSAGPDIQNVVPSITRRNVLVGIKFIFPSSTGQVVPCLVTPACHLILRTHMSHQDSQAERHPGQVAITSRYSVKTASPATVIIYCYTAASVWSTSRHQLSLMSCR